jgi:hypothetical protein
MLSWYMSLFKDTRVGVVRRAVGGERRCSETVLGRWNEDLLQPQGSGRLMYVFLCCTDEANELASKILGRNH